MIKRRVLRKFYFRVESTIVTRENIEVKIIQEDNW